MKNDLKRTWRKVTITEAFEHASSRTIDRRTGTTLPDGSSLYIEYTETDPFARETDQPDDSVLFTDGSMIACRSQWRGPYSRETPDVDGQPPKWWISEE